MSSSTPIFESHHKKLGFISFNSNTLDSVNGEIFRHYIKVIFIPAGYSLTVDFNLYHTASPALFFVNTNQHLDIHTANNENAFLIHYNRDFYCIQIHDEEVACDGLLFNNIFEIPKVDLSEEELNAVSQLFGNINDELIFQDLSSEEMIRTYLKQIIIRATRQWKKQNLKNQHSNLITAEQDFFRNFSRLVDIHYKKKHSVAEYADLLNLAPKTISNKFHKLNLENPNEMIKNRIILEAKRLMLYSDLSIKEIAYELGYEDPAYFNRIFTQKSGKTPAVFRKEIKKQT
ncbi:helix-turn-helix domain-containing protein [Flavobacterium quisquiliarum]|uniref:Helix-turn-helix domain-containing protein n=1 Tax=Flavobacterium quisquiliarum TaxID=1834436 RepID=A0ABV8W207_9FLAO|nr:helix-turn-helix domain-containing protein [Flavobacterium quisquiliarum]MBW1654523.1 helix-turn-helix domain-containing protein [Flavobacterium quisquiliarum]